MRLQKYTFYIGYANLRFSLRQFIQVIFQRNNINKEHLPRFAAFAWTYDTCRFQLIHDATCTVVTNGKLAQNERSRTLLMGNQQAG